MLYELYENPFPELLANCIAKVDRPNVISNDRITYELLKMGVFNLCYIKGRGLCGLQRMMYTTGLFYGYDLMGYVGRYCYHTKAEAVEALTNWNGIGDPGGDWIKHKGVAEYSNPNKVEKD